MKCRSAWLHYGPKDQLMLANTASLLEEEASSGERAAKKTKMFAQEDFSERTALPGGADEA